MRIAAVDGALRQMDGPLVVVEAVRVPTKDELSGVCRKGDDPRLPSGGWLASITLRPRPVSPGDAADYEERGFISRLPSPGIDVDFPLSVIPVIVLGRSDAHASIGDFERVMSHGGVVGEFPGAAASHPWKLVLLFPGEASYKGWAEETARCLLAELLMSGDWTTGPSDLVGIARHACRQGRRLDPENPMLLAMETAMKMRISSKPLADHLRRLIEVGEIFLSRNELLRSPDGLEKAAWRLKAYRRHLRARLNDIGLGELVELLGDIPQRDLHAVSF